MKSRSVLFDLYQQNVRSGHQKETLPVERGEGATPLPFDYWPFDVRLRAALDKFSWKVYELIKKPLKRQADVFDERRALSARAPNGLEEAWFDDGLDMLAAVSSGDLSRLDSLISKGVPVNFQEPQYLESAMHISCSIPAASEVSFYLLKHPDIDLLLRDSFGRQPWNNAVFFGASEDVCAQVMLQTRIQAENSIGLELFEDEFRSNMKSWMTQPWFQNIRAELTPS